LLSTQNQQVVRNLRKEAERAAGIDSGDENEIKIARSETLSLGLVPSSVVRYTDITFL